MKSFEDDFLQGNFEVYATQAVAYGEITFVTDYFFDGFDGVSVQFSLNVLQMSQPIKSNQSKYL